MDGINFMDVLIDGINGHINGRHKWMEKMDHPLMDGINGRH